MSDNVQLLAHGHSAYPLVCQKYTVVLTLGTAVEERRVSLSVAGMLAHPLHEDDNSLYSLLYYLLCPTFKGSVKFLQFIERAI